MAGMKAVGKTRAGNARRRIQSIEVGFRVIRALEDESGPISLKTIAERSGMPASQAHLYLNSFIHEGFVYQDQYSGQYGLSSYAAQIGLSAMRQMDVVALSKPYLTAMNEETGCAVYLTIWGNRGPVIAAKLDGRYQGAMTMRIGYVFPLLTTTNGLVFAAYLPDSQLGDLLEESSRQTGSALRSKLSKRNLDSQLKAIRKQGYAMIETKINLGYTPITAPIFDCHSEITAAISILAPTWILGEKGSDNFVKLLCDAASELSRLIGYKQK